MYGTAMICRLTPTATAEVLDQTLQTWSAESTAMGSSMPACSPPMTAARS